MIENSVSHNLLENQNGYVHAETIRARDFSYRACLAYVDIRSVRGMDLMYKFEQSWKPFHKAWLNGFSNFDPFVFMQSLYTQSSIHIFAFISYALWRFLRCLWSYIAIKSLVIETYLMTMATSRDCKYRWIAHHLYTVCLHTLAFLLWSISVFKSTTSFGFLIKNYMGHVFLILL